MAQQTINVGTTANDGTGDALRNAFIKANDNFTELYTDRISGSGTTNQIPKFTGANSIGSSILTDRSGKIGINLTTPVATLDVQGASGNAIRFRETTTGNLNTFILGTGSGFGYIDVTATTGGSSSYFATRVGSSEKMRITSNGNLLVNTTTDQGYKLQVNGAISSSTFLRVGDISAQIGVIGSEFSIFGAGGNDWTFYNGGATSNVFYTSGTERLRITSSGNVGIGTSYPTGKLDLVDYDRGLDGYGNFNIFTNDSASTSKGGSIAFGGNNSTGGTTPYPFAKIQGIKSSEAGSYRGALRFATASSSSELLERMRIDHNGNVGIGTTSPSQKLSIVGGSSTYAQVNNGSNSIYLGQISSYGLIQSDLDLALLSGGSERMRITSAGNVGIGTTSPTAKLQVVGLPSYADNTTALAGGLTAGAFYHTAGVLKVVI